MEAALEAAGLTARKFQRKKPAKAFIKVGGRGVLLWMVWREGPASAQAAAWHRARPARLLSSRSSCLLPSPTLTSLGCLDTYRKPLTTSTLPPQRGVGTAKGIAAAFKKEKDDAAARVKRQEELSKR